MVPIDYEDVPKEPYAGPGVDDRAPRIVFFGIPSDYGTAFLLHLIEKRANLVAVVCSTRWQRTHPKADLVSRIAGHLGRPVEVASDVNTEPFMRCLKGYAPDVVVMASFDQIVRAQTLDVPRGGWLNIHPSLLPRHRGPEPIYWTILNGDRSAGITVHLTVPRVDAGPILAQRRVEVRARDTTGTLCKRLVAEGLQALDDTLDGLSTDRASGTVPNLAKGSYDPPVHQPVVAWDQPFEQLDRLVRAGDPDQPPSFMYRGRRRFVRAARRVRPRKTERTGVLEPLAPDELLATVADAVVALRLQTAGHTHALPPLAKQRFP